VVIYDESIFTYWKRFPVENYKDQFLRDLPSLHKLPTDIFLEAPQNPNFSCGFVDLVPALLPFLVGASTSGRVFVWGHFPYTASVDTTWNATPVCGSFVRGEKLAAWGRCFYRHGFEKLLNYCIGNDRSDVFCIPLPIARKTLRLCKELFSPQLLDVVGALKTINNL